MAQVALRILLADDEADHRELIREVLCAERFELVETDCAETALSVLSERPFDALILDYMMPGLSGLEALPSILQRHPDLAVIVTTARGDEEIAASALRAGATDYVVKTGNLGQRLPMALERAIETVRLRAASSAARHQIEHLNSVLLAIRNVNQLIAKEKDAPRLLEQACHLLTETRGYRLAWIAIVDQAEQVAAVYEAVPPPGAGTISELAPDMTSFPCLARALQAPGLIVIEHPSEDCADCPMSACLQDEGVLSICLRQGSSKFGVLTVTVPSEVINSQEEQALFVELASDIGFALHALQTEQARRQAEENLVCTNEQLRLEVAERKAVEQQLMDYEADLRSLASELTLAEERQRRCVATDLHDSVVQLLGFANIKLGLLKTQAKRVHLDDQFEEVENLLVEAIQHSRSVVAKLGTPTLYQLGFEAAVHGLCEQFEERSGVPARFTDDGVPKPLSRDAQVILFQAVRELLTNVATHARATSIRVAVRRQGEKLVVQVCDNGVGLTPDQLDQNGQPLSGAGGLFSFRERLRHIQGTLRVETNSHEQHGTRVILTAPLQSEATPDYPSYQPPTA